MIEAPQRTERLLEKSGRITPREVLEAYETTGRGVCFDGFGDEFGSMGKACAIGALMARDGVSLHSSVELSDWLRERSERVGMDYYGGFYRGFDGFFSAQEDREGRQSYRNGYRDGQRVRAFVLDRYRESPSRLED